MSPAAPKTAPGRLSGRLVVRLTVILSALIALACVVLSMLLIRQHLTEMHRSVDAHGRAISEFIARQGELGVLSGDAAALRELARVALAQRNVVSVRFVDRDGLELVSVRRGGVEREDVVQFQERVTTVTASSTREELGFGDVGSAGAAPPRDVETAGWVVLGIGLGPYRAQRRTAMLTATGFAVIVITLSVLSGALLIRGPLKSLATAADIAEERSRVAELKSRFVAVASHEFRTPLAVILAASQVLKRYSGRLSSEKQAQRLDKIQKSVRQMTDLLDDVLTVERADSGRLTCAPQTVDLEAMCREIVADVEGWREVPRIVVETRLAEREGAVDPKLVRQILRNLLTNALKYSPGESPVTLEATSTAAGLRFRVADQGIGIPEADIPQLFEPFERAANVGTIEGTGLGLAITRRAVEAHGGTITVESVAGEGTTFTVDISFRSGSTTPRETAA